MKKPPRLSFPLPPPAQRMSRPGRRERRRTETRERLFRAALRVFVEKGFSETTVEDITNAADVGKGTFFNYFPSKDHILIAFGDMQLGKLREQVGEARRSKESMPQILRQLSLRMTEEPGRNPEIVRLILLAHLSIAPVRAEMCKRQIEALQLIRELIEIGQQRREIRSDRPSDDIAHTFRQLVFGTLLLWSSNPDGPLKQRIDSALDLLWKGMEAPRAAAREKEP